MLRHRFCLAGALALTATASYALPPVTIYRVPGRVNKTQAVNQTQSVDETHAVTLAGNVHPLARAEFDQGPLGAETRLDRMMLLLQPSSAQQAALDALMEAQQNPRSPLYRHWLTPAEFGAQFGASAQNLARVSAWLASHGFTVEEIPAGNRLVVFSGTAGEVLDAFHTEIHRYNVNGALHIANAQDPQIPASLSGVIKGVVSLHDFRHSSQIRTRMTLAAQPEYSAGSTHYLFPADFAAIYDLNPLYSAGTEGDGTAIAIAGRSNINLSDVATFRATAGLAANAPAVILAAGNPGLVAGDQDESTLDVEWSGAVAPAAAVSLVAAPSTATTDGIDLAAEYIVNHATAPLVSVSYGSCEPEMGAAELAFYNSLWEQAASEGMSVFVASGDAGASGCSAATASTGTEAAVNGLCSSPYATCVGGTELNEGANPAEYWAAANAAGYGSALGYIPEVVWNESAINGGKGLWASGGGVSAVYAQPAWQAEVSGARAANGMRAVPDVALSAADHDGYMTVENGSFAIVSGTSASAPSFAGIMALVVEGQGGKGQGNANPGLYALVSAQQDPFHATPAGNNSVPGVAGFTASGADLTLATGLGSVDGAVLAANWAPSEPPTPTLTLTLTAAASSVTVVEGGSAMVSFTAVTGGPFSGSVNFSVSGLPAGVSASWSTNPLTPESSASANPVTLTFTASTGALAGSSNIVVTAQGDGLSSAQRVTVAVQSHVICCCSTLLLRARCGKPAPSPVHWQILPKF